MKTLNPMLIASFRKKFGDSRSLHTNCIHLPNHPVWGKQSEKTLIFLLPNSSHQALYFISSDTNDLEKELQSLERNDVYVEIVCRGDLDVSLKNALSKSFVLHASYEELVINVKYLKLKLAANVKEIQNATLQDLQSVFEELHRNFDSRFDRLPNEKTLKELILKNQVRLIKADDSLKALAIHTITGKTARFDCLLNLGADSFELIALIESLYKELFLKNVTNVRLWVDVLKNPRVKAMHLKYGYQSANVFNHAFIPKENAK